MVTRDEILDLALLAKLNVADDEIDELTKEMANIIAFADTINAASDAGEDFDNLNNLANRFHEDEVHASYPQAEILRNVNGGENGCFYIKKNL